MVCLIIIYTAELHAMWVAWLSRVRNTVSCLQINDQLRAKAMGFELWWNYELIDVAQVYYELAVI